jgi:predicted membrane channel-forming protein YqfA (hemolysin III family)
MQPPRTRLLTGWFAAAALLLVTASATVHEIKHDLGQHEDLACALHALADHAGKMLLLAPATAPVILFHPVAIGNVAPALPGTTTTSFRARAPPVSSV